MIELRLLGGIEVAAPASGEGAAAAGEGIATAPDEDTVAMARSPTSSDLGAFLSQSKPTALLAYLHLAGIGRESVQPRDKMAALLWPDLDRRRGRAALSQTLYVLRNSLGREAIRAVGAEGITLATGAVASDAARVRLSLAEGRRRDALTEYGGDLLAGLSVPDAPAFQRWLDAARADLRTSLVAAAWALAEESERERNVAAAGHWVRRAVELAPLDEANVRRAMASLARLGDPAAALRVHQGFEARSEGTGPGKASWRTRRLAARIRRGAKAGPETTGWPGRLRSRRLHAVLVPAGAVVLAVLGWRLLEPFGPETAVASVPGPSSAVISVIRASGTTDPTRAASMTAALQVAFAKAGLALPPPVAAERLDALTPPASGTRWVIAGDLHGEGGASNLTMRVIELDPGGGQRQVWAGAFREGGRPATAFADEVARAVIDRMAPD